MFEDFELSKTEKVGLSLGGLAMLAIAYCAMSEKKEIYDCSDNFYDTIDPPDDPFDYDYDDYEEIKL